MVYSSGEVCIPAEEVNKVWGEAYELIEESKLDNYRVFVIVEKFYLPISRDRENAIWKVFIPHLSR